MTATSQAALSAKKTLITLTPGSRVQVRSAGTRDEALVSTGVFKGLVSVGGDNSLAIELDGPGTEERGRMRLVPLNALLAIDILEAAQKPPEEEKRSDAAATAGYFR
jgi:hypothetical protein